MPLQKPRMSWKKSHLWSRLRRGVKRVVHRLRAGRSGHYDLMPMFDQTVGCGGMSGEVALNCSSNSSQDMDDPDDPRRPLPVDSEAFLGALEDEGLLVYRSSQSGCPVLSIGFGFIDPELAALSSRTVDELRFRESVKHLDKTREAEYERIFSQRYPMEPLVDGLPESLWLAWLEPSLPILCSIGSIKHRKSNLSRKKSPMVTPDGGPESHGDFQFLHFLLPRHDPRVRHAGMDPLLWRLEMSLENYFRGMGPLNMQPINELQARINQPQAHRHLLNIQHQRRMRQFRPYPPRPAVNRRVWPNNVPS